MKRYRNGELNVKEKRVLKVMPTDEAVTIAQISRKAWPAKVSKPLGQGNWTVRNCLRKLTKLGHLHKVGLGLYALNVK
jgi:hypothetical protein